ncbi:MAG: tyrosine-type recombinase/integrase [Acidobacteria bacterium]|nr:tyrosine-type recombinase/integrase [Acidobacteriota bacterium]
MSVREELDKLGRKQIICDRRWPDGTRFRRVMPNRKLAADLDARIHASVVEGTWHRLKGRLERGAPKSEKLSEFADRYLDEYCKAQNRCWKRKMTSLKPLKKKLGHLPLAAIRPKHVYAYIRWRKEQNKDISNASINRDVTILKHMLKFAREVGAVRKTRVRSMKKLPELRRERPKAADEQVDGLLASLPEQLRPLFGFIRETGCRLEEGLSVKHHQIRRNERMVVFTDNTKSGKFRLVPLTEKCLEHIDSSPALPGCPYVFWNENTRTRYKDVHDSFHQARDEAGLPWFQIKDLRRHYGIVLSESGAEMHVIQAVLGHSSVATTEKYYAHFSPTFAARRALTVLEGRGRKTGGTAHEPDLRLVSGSGSDSAK